MFATRNILKDHHLSIHDGKKDYKCDFCDKLFPIDYAKTHIQICLKERKAKQALKAQKMK